MKRNTRSTARPRQKKAFTFTESFNTKGADVNASCFFHYSKEDAYRDELCICDDPMHCECRSVTGPTPAYQRMDQKLFKHPRPFLMFSVQRGKDANSRFSFFCKVEKEVKEEIFRLNSRGARDILWEYTEEEQFNEAVKIEYRQFMNAV